VKSPEVIAKIKEVLDKPVAMPEGVDDSNERLIYATCVLLYLEPLELRDVIINEAFNRWNIGKAVGKKPWEMVR
jgi:hypothetical protein